MDGGSSWPRTPSFLLLGIEALSRWEPISHGSRAPALPPVLQISPMAHESLHETWETSSGHLVPAMPKTRYWCPGFSLTRAKKFCVVSVRLKWISVLCKREEPWLLDSSSLPIKNHKFSFVAADITIANDNGRGSDTTTEQFLIIQFVAGAVLRV